MPDKAMELTVTASSILFGFLFAGFWWALDRELEFKPGDRHFKLSYLLLFATMVLLAVFGVLRPLWAMQATNQNLRPALTGVTLAVIGVFGYMLTEFGHYEIFQRPKYTTKLEWVFFLLTVAILAIGATKLW